MLWREKRTKLFSWKFYGCKYPAFSRGKYFFCHQVPIPRITKTCSPDVSELCKDMARTPCPIPWKRGQGRVHCECWLPYLLLPCLGEIVVLRDDFQTKKWKAACFFQKTQILDQSCCFYEEIIGVFFWQVWGYNYPAFPGEILLFPMEAQFPGS